MTIKTLGDRTGIPRAELVRIAARHGVRMHGWCGALVVEEADRRLMARVVRRIVAGRFAATA